MSVEALSPPPGSRSDQQVGCEYSQVRKQTEARIPAEVWD